MHIAREAEREEKERSPEPTKHPSASKTLGRSRSASPPPGSSGRRRAATFGGVGVGGAGMGSTLGSPIQRSNLSPSFENLMSIGTSLGQGGGGISPSSRSFSPRGSPRCSPRLKTLTPGGVGGWGDEGGGAAVGAGGEKVLRLSKFFASLTSDRSLVSEATVCALVGSELPMLLDASNVSLWVKDASGTHLWNTQDGEKSEKLVVDAADGLLGACVHGRTAQKMTKPTWTDIGTMRIPGMGVSEPVESVLCVPVEVGGEVIAALQVVSLKRSTITSMDEDLAYLVSRVVAFSLMMMRVSGVVAEREEITERVIRVSRGVKGAQFLFSEGLDKICEDLIAGHVQSLLGGRDAICTLYLADGDVLAVPGRPDWPAMALGVESSLVGKCGWLGIAQLYNNVVASGVGGAVNRAESSFRAVSPADLSSRASPTKTMMGLSGIGGSSSKADVSSSFLASGRLSPQQAKLNEEGGSRAVCLPLVLPYSDDNKRFGAVNKDGNIVVGVLRVSERQDGGVFTEADITTLLCYSSQLVVSICALMRQREVMEKATEDGLAKHKKDKRVAYAWKKSSDAMAENCARVGDLCGELMSIVGVNGSGGEDGANVSDLVSAAGKEMLSCDDFGLVLREHANQRVPGGVEVPRDLVLQALRRGIVVKRGGEGLAALCVPVWRESGMYGVLCAVRRAGTESDNKDGSFIGVKEFTDAEESLVAVLGNILGTTAKLLSEAEMWGVRTTKKGAVDKKKRARASGYKRTKVEADVGDNTGDDDIRSRRGEGGDGVTDNVFQASALLARATTFDQIAQAINSVVKGSVQDCAAYLYRVEEKSRALKPLFPGVVKSVVMTSGLLGYVATTGKSELVSCARLHRLFDPVVDCHSRIGDTQPMWIMPLCDKRKNVIGVLQVVGRDRSEAFDDEEVTFVERLTEGLEDGLSRCSIMEALTEESYTYKQGAERANAEIEELKLKIKEVQESERVEKGRLLRLLTVCRNLLLERDTKGMMVFGEAAMKSLMGCMRASIYLIDEEKGELWSAGGEEVGGMEVRLPKGKGILGHVTATGKTVNMAGGGDLDLSNGGTDVRVESGFKTTGLLCIPIWDSRAGSSDSGGKVQRAFSDAKVIGAVMYQNKVDEKDGSHIKFDQIDEIIANIFADFVSVGVSSNQLHDRALYLSSEMHGQMQTMSVKIEEIMAGKQNLMTAEQMLRAEEKGERGRMEALKSLIDVSKELDAQTEVVDALLT